MLGVRDGYQNDAACTAMRAVRCPIVDGRTQWMVLSAAINNPEVASCLGGTHGGLLRLAVAKHSVIVDSDVVVGHRSRHRADVLGCRPHKAQTAVAAISGQRRARWHAFSQRRVRGARLRPNFFNHHSFLYICLAYV